jgi:hypothetical protein
MDIKEIDFDDVYWIHLAQDIEQLPSVVNA